jgi:hypothetical protein
MGLIQHSDRGGRTCMRQHGDGGMIDEIDGIARDYHA